MSAQELEEYMNTLLDNNEEDYKKDCGLLEDEVYGSHGRNFTRRVNDEQS